MPIGDLLASITGEAPKPSQGPSVPISTALKRKADNDLRGSAVKRPVPIGGASRSNGDSSRLSPCLPDRSTLPANGREMGRSANLNSTPTTIKREGSTSSARTGTLGSANGAKPVGLKPVVVRSSTSAPPKKGSFQEIMARAQAAQQARAGFGKIQHKTIERGITMKDRKDMKSQELRGARPKTTQQPQKSMRGAVSRSGSGTGAIGASNGTSAPGRLGGTRKPVKSPPADAKKLKKAATATTGYTGTARPRPQALAKPGSGARSDAKPRPDNRPRYPAALSNPRRRNDDYDEELDDFIEYDEEEEDEPGYGRRGGYDSLEDEESDMEAGLSDIDQEERRADMVARREDREQEELERKLKLQKEERKRQLMRGTGR